jgi:hypothetical protein
MNQKRKHRHGNRPSYCLITKEYHNANNNQINKSNIFIQKLLRPFQQLAKSIIRNQQVFYVVDAQNDRYAEGNRKHQFLT